MAVPSSDRNVHLIDGRLRDRPFIRAVLYRDYPAPELDVVDATWARAREEVWRSGNDSGLAPFEHAHWDWRNKADAIAGGRFLLIGVECESEPQGLMPVERLPRLGQSGKPVVYIDYLETAPWNLRSVGSTPRFLGVGTILLAEAVRLSVESGLDGRIGLHSLPQAEPFYRRLGLTEYGPDRDYFELSGQDAQDWLASLGGG